MSKTHEELKELFELAESNDRDGREERSNDTIFYWKDQWDGFEDDDTELKFRGVFDLIRKAGRDIQAKLKGYPVQVNFEPKDESRKDGAELIDGLYRSDARTNQTIEAFDNASQEAVICGVGGWERYTEYATNQIGDLTQVIKSRPLFNFNENVFFDPNAKLADKSDAMYCGILDAYSEKAYERLAEKFGQDETQYVPSFAEPVTDTDFAYHSPDIKTIYIATIYVKEEVTDKVLFMTNPLGEERIYRESDLQRDNIDDDLLDQGFDIINEKEITRYQVTRYIVSGAGIMDESVIAGEHIPVIPQYGERAIVQGVEHCEGFVRKAKDPQRLHNFHLSYLQDVASKSPLPKPIFTADQIGPYGHMYETGANYPYLLQASKGENDEPVALGPVGVMPETKVPTAVLQGIELSRQAVTDVANAGTPDNLADVDMSGKAVREMRAMFDDQAANYHENRKHAHRRDAEVYASMAAVVFDTPQTLTMTAEDGTRKKVQVMEMSIDAETGTPVFLNDLTNIEFEVFADIGTNYKTQKAETMDRLDVMAERLAAIDPNMSRIINMQQLAMMDGVGIQPITDYARQQNILSGITEPETEEEQALLMQSQQQQEPDANMVLAMAEQGKAQAAMAETQRKAMADQMTAQNNNAKMQVEVFKAQTDRIDTQIAAQKAGAEIDYKRVQQVGQQIDNAQKLNPLRVRLTDGY